MRAHRPVATLPLPLAFVGVIMLACSTPAHAFAAPAPPPALLAAGCGQDDAPASTDMRPVPAQPDAKLVVVAALLGSPDGDSLGSLCVALVRQSASGFASVAQLPDGSRPEPKSDVDHVTSTSVDIDPVPYRFAPGEAAFAVRVAGEFSSTSTEASWERLFLFRRGAGRLTLIFDAETATSETDKESAAPSAILRWIVRFAATTHRGAYDLIVAPRQAGPSRRYAWSGSAYRLVEDHRLRPTPHP